jgi:lipopolysaccharide export system protein LptA
MTDEAGRTTTDFSSGTATLDRTQNVLSLDQKAHVLRSEQELDADHVTARLSDDEQIVQYIELRGNARVTGGTSISSMSARDIDMDYTDDGRALERIVLTSGAQIAMGSAEEPGRQIFGESLDVRLAADGSILAVTGRNMVRLDLPASKDAPAGSIRAGALDGTGEEGRGLTLAEFRGDVEYREPGQRGGPGRVVRSQNLSASLADDAVTKAVFTGKVTFDDEGIGAHAGEIRYQPRENTIALSGSDANGAPHVALDQIAIDARSIDVALDDRRITAADVKTTLSPRPASASAGSQRGASSGVALPGLLKQDQSANINADALDYRGKSGQAVYTGRAALWQGETAIRGDTISLDQEKGALVATGSARSTLDLDTGRSTGRGHEIRYDDMRRIVTYSGAGLAPTSGRGSAPGARGAAAPADTRGAAPTAGRSAAPVRDAQLSGPQGDLSGERIEIVLAREGNQVERLEAYTKVTLRLDTRTGAGDRLTYHAKEERYVMSGTTAAPVTITAITSDASTGAKSCRETTGRTLTFFKSTDTIDVDGNGEKRTETQMKPCTPPSSR